MGLRLDFCDWVYTAISSAREEDTVSLYYQDYRASSEVELLSSYPLNSEDLFIKKANPKKVQIWS